MTWPTTPEALMAWQKELAGEAPLVDATGRDHPRRAGLATSLGAVLDLPTVGCWLRTRTRARPLAVHPAWRTDLDTAIEVVLGATRRVRTPEPLRTARTAARRRRRQDGS